MPSGRYVRLGAVYPGLAGLRGYAWFGGFERNEGKVLLAGRVLFGRSYSHVLFEVLFTYVLIIVLFT